jgi:hypothetical protein
MVKTRKNKKILEIKTSLRAAGEAIQSLETAPESGLLRSRWLLAMTVLLP